jgi:hypothetical protein
MELPISSQTFLKVLGRSKSTDSRTGASRIHTLQFYSKDIHVNFRQFPEIVKK